MNRESAPRMLAAFAVPGFRRAGISLPGLNATWVGAPWLARDAGHESG